MREHTPRTYIIAATYAQATLYCAEKDINHQHPHVHLIVPGGNASMRKGRVICPCDTVVRLGVIPEELDMAVRQCYVKECSHG